MYSNIKVVVWYGDSRFQRFLMISSHFHRKFQFWIFFYLVTKTSTQLLNLDPGGSGGETYIKWKTWRSSFRRGRFSPDQLTLSQPRWGQIMLPDITRDEQESSTQPTWINITSADALCYLFVFTIQYASTSRDVKLYSKPIIANDKNKYVKFTISIRYITLCSTIFNTTHTT